MEWWICEWVWPTGQSKIHVFNHEHNARLKAAQGFEHKLMAKVWKL